MGAHNSGKSSLLQVLAGHTPEASAEVSGSLLWNGSKYDIAGKEPWELCAYVGAVDEHWRDLSVNDIVTYAMSLRVKTAQHILLIPEFVEKTLDLVQLTG